MIGERPQHLSLSGLTAFVIALMVMVGASDAHASGLEPLAYRYESVSVVRDGEPRELVKGTPIWLRFKQRKRHDLVSWQGGCNRLGSQVEIRPWRLRTGQISGTKQGCKRALRGQEEWLVRFFDQDPSWAVRGRRLRLRVGDDVIRLRRRSRSGFCPATQVRGERVRAGPFVGLIDRRYDVFRNRFRLRVGKYRNRRTGLSQKIPWWISRQADVGRRLRIKARRLRLRSPGSFDQTLRRTSAVGDETRWFFPSIIKPAAKGCWRLRFGSGGTTGAVIVLVRG